jgi:hypothetical protein
VGTPGILYRLCQLIEVKHEAISAGIEEWKMILCHCGSPLHYTQQGLENYIQAMVDELGEMIRVTVDGRTWLVPRHYIALHGLRASEIATLGFQEKLS